MRRRNKPLDQQTISIKTNSSLLEFIDWLHRRLFVLKTKFSFRISGENEYILLDDFVPNANGVTFGATLNRKEKIGIIDITCASENTKRNVINVHYRYPKNLSEFISNLILDVGFIFQSFESIPQELIKNLQDPDPLPEEIPQVMELEFFLENATNDHFCDWVISEYQDILAKFFPTTGWLLEIQPPKILVESKNHRTITMEGRLYEHGISGLALFVPNPLKNSDCVSFSTKQLSTTRLHVVCKANKFALEHFREVLGKIERNWPETKENIRRFLIAYKGESVVPIIVSMGPTINVVTGEVVPEPEKYYRAEYKFRGSPLQFLAFITHYGKIWSDKYKNEIVDLIEQSPNMEKHTVQVKAMFFPLVHLDSEHQKGVFGEIVVMSLPDQTSMLLIEAERHCWDKVQKTWEIILSELKRHGWVENEETKSFLSEKISLPSDVFISYSHKDSEYAYALAEEFKRTEIIPWIDGRIDYGTQWPQVIEENLNSCPIFVVIMSSNARESDWVQNELAFAQRKKKKIFPLLLEGDNWLPLEITQYVDVRSGKMPPQSFFTTIKEAIGQKLPANESDSKKEANQISGNIILKYYDMPSISRVPPLRVEVENKNSQSITCKAFIKEAVSFSPDDNIKKYLGSSEFFWKSDSKSIVKEKKIEAGGVGTVYLADINKEYEYLFFVVQKDVNAYVKPFRKLGEYRIAGEIQAIINKRQFIKEFNLTFEVVISPKTNKRFIRTVQANIPKGD